MWEWFLRYWSSVGLGAAAVLILLLFCTNVCRSRLDVSRWRDPVWMAWTYALAYLLHNFEEYGFDAKGRPFAFPAAICQQFGYDSLNTCPVSLDFVLAVNLPIVWVALPLAAVCSRRHPAVGLTGAGFVLVNGLSHIASGLIGGYNPGLLTAVAIFVPLAAWSFIMFFGADKLLRYPVLGMIVLASFLVHVVLIGLIFAQMRHVVGVVPASILQTLSGPLLLLVLPWLAERRWPSASPPVQINAPSNGIVKAHDTV